MDKKPVLQFRVRRPVYERLRTAAKESGRSIAEEAALLLEHNQTKRTAGRPTKESTTPRASLGLRVTRQVKRRLDETARLSGRSQSQEAEFRLERSFRDDDLRTLLQDILPQPRD